MPGTYSKWPDTVRITTTRGLDAKLIRAGANLRRAERAMDAAASEAEREDICLRFWLPAYAEVCRRPAVTWRGLAVKMRVLLDQHEHGEGPCSAELRETVRRCLGLLDGERTHHGRMRDLSG